MEKISINLIPVEFEAEEVKKSKFNRIQAIGISVILFMIFLSVLTVAFRILQTGRINAAQAKVSEAEEQVSAHSAKQASLFLLKDRLSTINKYEGVSSKQAEIYNLLNQLIPANLSVNEVSIGRQGSAAMSVLIPDVQTLDVLTSNFLDIEKNKGKISKVSIEALNRSRDGIFRMSLRIEPK